MLLLRKPSGESTRQFLTVQAKLNLAFSRPNHFLTRLGHPIVRRTQKQFGRESAAAMLKAVRSDDERRVVNTDW